MDISSADYHKARRNLITRLIDPEGRGLEIGPSHNPATPKSAGYRVEIVDHMDQAGLKEKYKEDIGINTANIEVVDHVWTGGSLCDVIGETGCYDWIVAAHVIEHMPDLVGFLQECQKLLVPRGLLSLVVPDKRYCFDHLRRRSSTGDVLQAHLESRTRHSPGQVFDHFSSACKLGENGSWHRNSVGLVQFAHTPAFAEGMFRRSRDTDDYLDVHAWVFTPSSFRLIIGELNMMGVLSLNECSFTDTRDCEFFIAFSNESATEIPDRARLAKQALQEERQAFFP